ncbi:MAG: hypothetical protein EP335_03410 [Alphaproteobacteria bacterium]|nr:MAG: hypothetical protein EP335_03410 [Alphaproteobacteria bacterium]
MTMTPISGLIVDGILAFLLLGVIVVSTIVYRRLGTIKAGQAELRDLVDSLNTAVLDAQRSVSNLKHAAVEIEGRLQVQTQKASAIADELGMITEAGNNLADRIEKGLTGAGTRGAEPQGGAKPAQKQQQELLAALREAR